MGSVDVNSGEYCTFGAYEHWDHFADLIVASGSAPVYFPPMQLFDRLWMDGGTAYNLELPSLVEHCRKQGFFDE